MSYVNKVCYNLNQRNDTTVQERATARNNIDAAENKGFVECYRSFSDGSFVDTWFKICEMNVGTGSNYSYGYELALKLVVTNNGSGDCPCESATMNMGCNFIPGINVGRSEVAWSDHTANNHAECSIDGVKILTHRASDNYGPRDKIEVWLKATKYFTYYTQMRVECIANAGNQCYRSSTSIPTMLVLPWQFRNSMITGTHTDPFNDASHPAAATPGAAGWSEVYYPCETKTVMVDHDQNFTLTEQAQARNNIGAYYYKGKLLNDYHDPESNWSSFTQLDADNDKYQQIFTFNNNIQDYIFDTNASYRYTNFFTQFCCAIDSTTDTLIRWDIVDEDNHVVSTGQYDHCPVGVSYHTIDIATIFGPNQVTSKNATYGIGLARWDGNAWSSSDKFKLCGAFAHPVVWIKYDGEV